MLLLRYFCTRTDHFFPETIIIFYSNLSIKSHGDRPTHLISRIGDMNVNLSTLSLSKVLHTNHHGVYFINNDWTPLHVPKIDVIHQLQTKIDNRGVEPGDLSLLRSLQHEANKIHL